MKCPHCLHDIFPAVAHTNLDAYGAPQMVSGDYSGKPISLNSEVNVCPRCHGVTVDIDFYYGVNRIARVRAYPRTGAFPPAPAEVPLSIAADYAEANEVLPISPKSAAALARRCLQGILSSHGYKGKNLVNQIDAALGETDTTKALPTALRDNIDAIRNFGNFSAHPINDVTSLQVIEVEEGEAEWCLQILLDLFDHYYVAPAKAAERRTALAAKLAATGKPPMK